MKESDSLSTSSEFLTCCNFKFKTDSVFKLHRLKMHGEIYQSQNSQQAAAGPTVPHGDVETNSEQEHDKVKILVDFQPAPVFNCKYCGKHTSASNMKRHIQTKHIRVFLKCPKCEYTNCWKSDIKMHFKAKHTDKTNNACQYCGKQISATNMTKHLSTLQKCPNCEYTHCWKSAVKRHVKTTHNTDSPCQYCGKQISASYMEIHIKFKHFSALQKCYKCEYTSARKNDVITHFKIRHTEKYNTPCQFCGKVFKIIKEHLRNTMCGKDKDDREKTTCEHCGIIVSNRNKLKHIKHVHDKVKDKQCTHCHYTTYSNFNLKLHVSKVHLGKSLEYESCPHCSERTSNMKRHLNIYHSEHLNNESSDIAVENI